MEISRFVAAAVLAGVLAVASGSSFAQSNCWKAGAERDEVTLGKTESPPDLNRTIPDRMPWGNTQLHISYSPDAFLMQNRSAGPDTAYRYARGLPVMHSYRKARIQIDAPLVHAVILKERKA